MAAASLSSINIRQKQYCCSSPWLGASSILFSNNQSRALLLKKSPLVVVRVKMEKGYVQMDEECRLMSSATGNINGYSNNHPMITVNVDLGPRSYPVYIGSGLLDHQPRLFKCRHVDGKQALIVTNNKIAPLFLDKTVNALKQGNPQISVVTLILPDGEQFKNMESVMKVFDAAIKARMDRRCTFVAVGGGVVGDICGYAAASYLRGVNYIHVPTTFTSQVDSSVGGKTGVNYRVGKNLIGAIHQPKCVVVDTHTLNSLPNRELVSGFAESIKCGLVRDGQYFEWIENNLQALLARDPKAVAYAIKRSCEIKGEIVGLDEKENGIRAILNFGHTFGHAIEASCGYGNWLHGEAVAVGMVMAAEMSYRLGWINGSIVKRLKNVLQRAKLPITPPPTMTVEKFKSGMEVDKKVADGMLRLVLLKGSLGSCVFTGSFEQKALHHTLLAFTHSKISD
ncbi:UNVERIFIED_CONTAM: 3-dehydroquinate synthase, chloroplastic [Sesamum calycinum]|uniref:3-dehydroquinate synthase, chloroplastic n=1 Tax=Sesamum calycinum TaxID=2727403 RepID=A0AAW2LXP8_9LAMI